MRGADLSPFRDDVVPGTSTPACAGLAEKRFRRPGWGTLYPRMRGADSVEDESVLYEVPPPPRARG